MTKSTSSTQPGIGLIVCFQRCLYCGRRTNHEVCHKHSDAIHGNKTRYPISHWRAKSYNAEAEKCEDDECPQGRQDWK